MSFLQNLTARFSKKPKVSIEEIRSLHADLIERIEAVAKPALVGSKTDRLTNSYSGGQPRLSMEIEWPKRGSREMDFIAQIDLAEVPRVAANPPLPAKGTLFFFVDVEDFPTGDSAHDRDGFAVIYLPHVSSEGPERARQTGDKVGLVKQCLEFRSTVSYPSSTSKACDGWDIPEVVEEHWSALFSHPNDAKVQLLGYPEPIQGDEMDLESEAMAMGYGAKEDTLQTGREKWMLLAQFEGPDEAECLWGDAGLAYFWIRKDDLANLDFSSVWMITQFF